MATTTFRPFRFLDLPGEIRTMIYGHLFANAVLILGREDEPVICLRLRNNYDSSVFSFPDDLPPILRVCRAIRQEALPMFSAATAFGVSEGDDLDRLLQNYDVFRPYLEHCTTAYVEDYFEGMVDEKLMPALRELYVFCWIGLEDVWEVDFLCDCIRKAVAEGYLGRSVRTGDLLYKRELRGPIPFQVFLQVHFEGHDYGADNYFPCRRSCASKNTGDSQQHVQAKTGTALIQNGSKNGDNDQSVTRFPSSTVGPYVEECLLEWPSFKILDVKKQ